MTHIRSMGRRGFVILGALFVVILGTLSAVSAVPLVLLTQSVVPSRATGSISGTVVVKDSRVALSYASVSIPALQLERVTDSSGHFVFSDVAAGPVTIRVRHIGYTPVDLTVVVEPGETTLVAAQLDRFTVTLDSVHVVDHPACTQPGKPKGGAERTLLTAFQQAARYADRIRAATRGPSPRTLVERTIITRLADGGTASAQAEAFLNTSDTDWPYVPGEVLTTGRRGLITSGSWGGGKYSLLDPGPPMLFDIAVPGPTLFADAAFVDKHCFWYAGNEVIDRDTLVRIDFDADRRLEGSDLAGSLYLDPHGYAMRRSVIHLTKIPPGLDEVRALAVASTFTETPADASMVDRLAPITTTRDAPGVVGDVFRQAIEDRRLVVIMYLRGPR